MALLEMNLKIKNYDRNRIFKRKRSIRPIFHNLKMNGYKDMDTYQNKNHLSSNFFACAFLWDSTHEGHDY